MATTPSDSWFCLTGERPTGPLSPEQLRAAVTAGVVRPETMVCKPGWPRWRQAGEVPGLFPNQVAVPPGVSAASQSAALKPAVGAATPPPLAAPKPTGDLAGLPPLAVPRPTAAPPTLPPLAVPVPAPESAALPPLAVPHLSVPGLSVPNLAPGAAALPPLAGPRFTAGSATPPTAAEPDVIEQLGIEVADVTRPTTALKRRKKRWPFAVFMGLLGAPVCAALVFVSMNTSLWTTTPVEPDSRPRAPAKRPVAEAPKKSGTDKLPTKPKGAEADDTDARMSEWDLRPVVSRVTFESSTPPTPQGRIDELVFAKWKELGIEPANLCTDSVFLRRVYLDVLGTLPTPQEAKTFLTDKSPDKRKKLVDAVLQRPEFAEFAAMKWSDLLRVKAEFPINLWPAAAQAYHRWIRNSIRDNLPYDKFVRELLTSSGSNFRVPQVNFYRALQSKDPKGIARAVALTFMGCRAEKWSEERLTGLSGFFFKVGYKRTGEWKEEIVFFEPEKVNLPPPPPAPPPGAKKSAAKAPEKKPQPIPPPPPVFPDGTPAEIPANKDPRGVIADWLVSPRNPWFTRAIVNRVWYWLEGRGGVPEPDDIRPDNRPSNPELLNYLAEELVKAKYDLKHIYRLILNSSTYQLSSLPKSKHPEAAAHFASYAVRRLEAEVIIDALNQITGTTESYSSIIPEPYTFIPETRRAISLPDGSISSSFLELFGRPPRDSGMESERNNRITAGQRLHLLNSSHVRNKLRDGPGMKSLCAEGDSTENLYLAILSRFPGEGEGGAGSGEGLAWTLINSTEFLFRH